MSLQLVSIRSNRKVIEAFARRGRYLEEFDQLEGVLLRDERGFLLYIAEFNLNVYLGKISSKRATFAAIGTGSASNES